MTFADQTPVGVLGAGLMGHGIALVFALHGHGINLYDLDWQVLQSVPDRVQRN